jgi:L-ribulokinase
MATKKFVLGIDYGTLSGRALLVDVANGKEVASEVYEYANAVIENTIPGEKTRLEPDTALQDPNDYLEVLKRTVPKVLAKAKVKASQVIGVTTDFTASSPLPCYADGTPLCFDSRWRRNPHSWVKLWKHHAAQPEADFINEVGRKRNERFITTYGGKYSSEWFFSKLLQVVNDSPEIYDACERWIESADWIIWQLTGRECRCWCTAGYKAMWVYPYGSGWAYPSQEFFAALNPKLHNVYNKLSMDLYPLGSCAGKITKAAARMTGLQEGTPVAVGNVDAHAAVPACTVTTPGKMVMIMGTSICNMLLGNDYRTVEGMCGTVYNGIIDGYWGYEAGQSAVGDIYAWFVDNAVPHEWQQRAEKEKMDIHQLLSHEAAKLKVGQSGLLALDWWNGNRSILVDATVSGCMFGLNLSTTAPEIYRALIEATAFGQRKIMDAFESKGLAIQELYACGGLATKNDILMQIFADILGRPIYVAASEQTCALGSAIHAAVVAGYYPDVKTAASKMARVREHRFEPNEANHRAYGALYDEYQRLHDLLGRHHLPTMKQLRNLRTAGHR